MSEQDIRDRVRAKADAARTAKADALKARVAAARGDAQTSATPTDFTNGYTPPSGPSNDVAMLTGILNGIGLGFMPNISAAMTAPANAVIDRTSLGDAYRKYRDVNVHAANAIKDAAPGHFQAGELIGSLAPGALTGGTADLVYGGLRTGKFGLDPLIRAVLQGFGGATVGAVDSAGHDQDPKTGALLGGALGAVGQGIQDTVAGLATRMSPAAIKEAVAKRVFGDMGEVSGGKLTPESLSRRLDELGDGAMIGDTDPLIRAGIESTTRGGVHPEAVGQYASVAQTRDTDVMAEDAIMQAFSNPKARSEQAAERKAVRAQLQSEYSTAVADMDAAGIQYDPQQLVQLSRQMFGDRPLAILGRAKALVDDAIATKGGWDGEQFTRPIKASEAVEIKQELDRAISSRDPQGPTADKTARNRLQDFKNALNDDLKAQWPAFAAVAGKYGGQFEQEAAWQLGFDAFKTNNKNAVIDAMNDYHGLSAAGQERFREGLVYALYTSADNKGAANVVESAAAARNSGLMAKISAAFGDDVAQSMLDDADRLSTFGRTNEGAAAMQRALAAATSGYSTSDAARIFDLVTVGALGGTHHMQSGAAFGAGRRVINKAIGDKQAAVNSELVKFGSLQGKEAQNAIKSLSEYFNNPHQPGIPAFNAGVLAQPLSAEQ